MAEKGGVLVKEYRSGLMSYFVIIYCVCVLLMPDSILLTILLADFLMRSTKWKQQGLFTFLSSNIELVKMGEPSKVNSLLDKKFAIVGFVFTILSIGALFMGYMLLCKVFIAIVGLSALIELVIIRKFVDI